MSAGDYQVELNERGLYVIRHSDGSLYNGGWYAKRVAQLACDSLNAGRSVQPGHKPDRLLVEPSPLSPAGRKR
jgi:hypothetical protein